MIKLTQTDIDRYNKGQSEYCVKNFGDYVRVSWGGHVKNGCNFTQTFIHDFLVNPKWKWRKVFDNDPDYQREFWEWMEDNCHGTITIRDEPNLMQYPLCEDEHYNFPPLPQMLTGYIIEFMEERSK